jgi:transketolase
LEVARNDQDVLVVTSDSRGSGKLTAFGEILPRQLIEVGIAEQNLVGIAAGLASCGKKVFAVSPASFLTARALEQIKNDVAYANHPVKLVGISAGVSYGTLGATHHSLHDLAALQAIYNLDIVVPGDNFESREAVLAAYNHPRPIYLRFGKRAMPENCGVESEFRPGQGRILSEGRDLVFIATGETVQRAVDAVKLLRSRGVDAGVISMHTLSPFDEACVLAAARKTRAVITVEEHSVNGGLGSRCAGLLLQAGVNVQFHIAGIPYEEMVNGSQDEIFRQYCLDDDGLVERAIAALQLKESK